MYKFIGLSLLAAGLGFAVPASAQVERITSNPPGLLLQGAKVKAGTEMFFLSGQLASPKTQGKPMNQLTLEDMGDTKEQAISTFTKIKTILESNGYAMSDIVKLSLLVAADPRLGRMDFNGANEAFRMFFGTAENPNTVARTTWQVGALVSPAFLIEIDVIAAKKP